MYGSDDLRETMLYAALGACFYVVIDVLMGIFKPQRLKRETYLNMSASKQDVLTVHEHLDSVSDTLAATNQTVAELLDIATAKEAQYARES